MEFQLLHDTVDKMKDNILLHLNQEMKKAIQLIDATKDKLQLEISTFALDCPRIDKMKQDLRRLFEPYEFSAKVVDQNMGSPEKSKTFIEEPKLKPVQSESPLVAANKTGDVTQQHERSRSSVNIGLDATQSNIGMTTIPNQLGMSSHTSQFLLNEINGMGKTAEKNEDDGEDEEEEDDDDDEDDEFDMGESAKKISNKSSPETSPAQTKKNPPAYNAIKSNIKKKAEKTSSEEEEDEEDDDEEDSKEESNEDDNEDDNEDEEESSPRKSTKVNKQQLPQPNIKMVIDPKMSNHSFEDESEEEHESPKVAMKLPIVEMKNKQITNKPTRVISESASPTSPQHVPFTFVPATVEKPSTPVFEEPLPDPVKAATDDKFNNFLESELDKIKKLFLDDKPYQFKLPATSNNTTKSVQQAKTAHNDSTNIQNKYNKSVPKSPNLQSKQPVQMQQTPTAFAENAKRRAKSSTSTNAYYKPGLKNNSKQTPKPQATPEASDSQLKYKQKFEDLYSQSKSNSQIQPQAQQASASPSHQPQQRYSYIQITSHCPQEQIPKLFDEAPSRNHSATKLSTSVTKKVGTPQRIKLSASLTPNTSHGALHLVSGGQQSAAMRLSKYQNQGDSTAHTERVPHYSYNVPPLFGNAAD